MGYKQDYNELYNMIGELVERLEDLDDVIDTEKESGLFILAQDIQFKFDEYVAKYVEGDNR